LFEASGTCTSIIARPRAIGNVDTDTGPEGPELGNYPTEINLIISVLLWLNYDRHLKGK
jgi:hypothetical protein